MSISSVSVASNEEALALSILKNLEVNTFHNSFRPGHYPEGTTVGQTAYHIYKEVEGKQGVYSATDKENSWVYSLRVMGESDKGVTVCFVDHNLNGSYLAASPLLVRKNKAGHYAVVKELPTAPSCEITNK
ncbi:pesticin immunity protein [Pseudomonas frederiksbergensis]|uniref:Pesticin immunity protein n=1 Tax=Pseudomonas frederiksbergensis TaxID=104087 RepID=A0A423JKS5_9PSED|nr:pesticin immunity protein [Pseudomonas frederiksbergensis]